MQQQKYSEIPNEFAKINNASVSLRAVVLACIRAVSEKLQDALEGLEFEDSSMIKRVSLMKLLATSRDALMRLLVLIKWSIKAYTLISTCQRLSTNLLEFDESYTHTVSLLGPYTETMRSRVYAIWDVWSGTHVMRRGTYKLLPHCISLASTPQSSKSDKADSTLANNSDNGDSIEASLNIRIRILERLHTAIRLRVFQESLPTLLHSISIHNGELSAQYSHMFSLRLSLRMTPKMVEQQVTLNTTTAPSTTTTTNATRHHTTLLNSENERIKWTVLAVNIHISDAESGVIPSQTTQCNSRSPVFGAAQNEWLAAVLSQALVTRWPTHNALSRVCMHLHTICSHSALHVLYTQALRHQQQQEQQFYYTSTATTSVCIRVERIAASTTCDSGIRILYWRSEGSYLTLKQKRQRARTGALYNDEDPLFAQSNPAIRILIGYQSSSMLEDSALHVRHEPALPVSHRLHLDLAHLSIAKLVDDAVRAHCCLRLRKLRDTILHHIAGSFERVSLHSSGLRLLVYVMAQAYVEFSIDRSSGHVQLIVPALHELFVRGPDDYNTHTTPTTLYSSVSSTQRDEWRHRSSITTTTTGGGSGCGVGTTTTPTTSIINQYSSATSVCGLMFRARSHCLYNVTVSALRTCLDNARADAVQARLIALASRAGLDAVIRAHKPHTVRVQQHDYNTQASSSNRSNGSSLIHRVVAIRVPYQRDMYLLAHIHRQCVWWYVERRNTTCNDDDDDEVLVEAIDVSQLLVNRPTMYSERYTHSTRDLRHLISRLCEIRDVVSQYGVHAFAIIRHLDELSLSHLVRSISKCYNTTPIGMLAYEDTLRRDIRSRTIIQRIDCVSSPCDRSTPSLLSSIMKDDE